MYSIKEKLTVESRLAWALIWIGVIIFLGALLWGFLNPHIYMMQEVSNQSSADSQAAQTGWERVTLVWSLWPLWFSLGLLYYGYNRAISESRQTP